LLHLLKSPILNLFQNGYSKIPKLKERYEY